MDSASGLLNLLQANMNFASGLLILLRASMNFASGLLILLQTNMRCEIECANKWQLDKTLAEQWHNLDLEFYHKSVGKCK